MTRQHPAGAAFLAAVVTILGGFHSAQGAGRTEPVPGEEKESVASQGMESAPAGRLDLVVRHRLERGRLIVRLAGCAFLSVPFAAVGGGAPASFERPLSVPSGKHPVEVSFLDRTGRLVAQKTTEGTVAAGGSITLQVDEHSGSGDGLTLTWRTP